jgi:hypothetical protein
LDSATGQPYKGTSATKVSVASSADLDDFRDAVKSKNSSILTGIASSQLIVYKNKAAFNKRNAAVDEGKEEPLEEDSLVVGFGTSKKEAFIVAVQASEAGLERRETDLEIASKNLEIESMGKREADLKNRETGLKRRETYLETRKTVLDIASKDLEIASKNLEIASKNLEIESTAMGKRETDLKRGETDLKKREADLERRETDLKRGETDLERRETDLERRETDLKRGEASNSPHSIPIKLQQLGVEFSSSEINYLFTNDPARYSLLMSPYFTK